MSATKDKQQVKRTSLFLDFALVRAAEDALGTSGTTETVRSALEDVVARQRRKQLAAWDLDGLTVDQVEQMRRQRIA